MRYLTAFILILTLAFAGRVCLTRDNLRAQAGPFPNPDLTIKVSTPGGIRTYPGHAISAIDWFSGFPHKPPARGRATIKVLVLKVEFVEDGDSITTGTGKMDLIGFGSPDDGLNYDPPHTKLYFQHHMEFLNNYFKSNSFGDLQVDFKVKPDYPTANYQLPQKMVYYSGFDHFDAENGIVYFNTYGQEMGLVRILADAVAAADQDPSIDFSQYDAMIIFHAGTLLQSSFNFLRFGDIPSATVPDTAVKYYLGHPILANSGSDTIDYPVSINAEMGRVNEYMVGEVGTVVHEFGHILGIPDLYDVYGWSNGVGAWDIMGTGGWSPNPTVGVPSGMLPTNCSAWTRYWMGWVNPALVTRPESLLTLRASEIDTTQYIARDRTMFKVPVSGTEFFLIENRQQDMRGKDTVYVDVEDGVPVSVDYGEYDFFLPGSGILVWHVDDNIVNNSWDVDTMQVNPKHKGVDLEEADGIQHFDAWWYVDSLEYYGSRYDAFWKDDSNKANRRFGPFTNPNSDSYFGKTMLNLDVLSGLDTLMDFSLGFDNYQRGFPVTTISGIPITAVSHGDLNADNHQEIVCLMSNGFLYAFDDTGGLYLNRYLGNGDLTHPAIGDINADGSDDIVFGRGFGLYAVDGQTFNYLDSFPYIARDAITGPPLLFDLNADGRLEIIFGSRDRYLYCLDSLADPIAPFPLYLNSELLSTPCVFDPARRRIGVLGSDGLFWIVDAAGIVKAFDDSRHNMVTYASPVAGDLDRDGEPEAVTINGYGTIYIYGADSLEVKFDILIDTTFYATPGLADLDRDGYLEIVMPNSSRSLYVTNRNGTAENNFPLHSPDKILPPLVVADFDDNGRSDIVFGLAPSDSLASGRLRIINDINREFSYSPLFGDGGFSSHGCIFDLDGDGGMELACGTTTGRLYVWEFPGRRCDWAGYMNSPRNTGYYDGVLPSVIAGPLIGSFYMYPSPVTMNGRVRFFLGEPAEVRVDILDITGRRIRDLDVPDPTANEYNEVEFDFSNQANGVYIVRVEARAGGRTEVKFKKFAVLKKGFKD